MLKRKKKIGTKRLPNCQNKNIIQYKSNCSQKIKIYKKNKLLIKLYYHTYLTKIDLAQTRVFFYLVTL